MTSDNNKSTISNNETLLSQKKYDGIPFRMDFIKELLNGNKIDPLVEFNDCDTEALIAHHEHKNDSECNDIRCILNKKFLNFNKVINQIGGRLAYIKSGTTGHTFKGMTSTDDDEKAINYAVKVVAYPKDKDDKKRYGDIYDIRRPENAEQLMLRVLSYFVINGQTPHIVLPIATFNTSIKPFITLTKNKYIENKKYDDFVKRYNNGEYHDQVSVLISEWANGGDFLDYIRNNYRKMTIRDWRVLFFQIISVLAIIQTKYPSFRHNDFKANNILLQKIDAREINNKFRYKINGCDYIVPNIGLQIKIWDFDFACIPGIVDNIKVMLDWTKKINITPEKNRYYDMHYFFNTLTKKGFFPQFFDVPEIPHQVKEFVRRIVPEEFADNKDGKNSFVHERGRILINKEYVIPDQVLQLDPFFSKMRPPNNKTDVSTDK